MSTLRFAAPKERRVAVITGGGRGIGRACALRIAAEGRDIVIADLDAGSDTVEAIEALGQYVLFIRTDVSDEPAAHAMMTAAAHTFGRIGILVCCAGTLGIEKPFFERVP